jgi:hypothetical protein
MLPSEIQNKRVLISPLNWGMGHVSRCIGLVNQLISQENSIYIACDEEQQQILFVIQDIPFVSVERGILHGIYLCAILHLQPE